MKRPCQANISIYNKFGSRRICCRFIAFYDAILRPSGLNATQRAFLQHLQRLGDRSVAEFATALGLDRAALSHTLRPLLHADVLEIVPSRDDRSVHHLRLTENGERRFRHAETLWREARDRFDATTGAGQASMLRTVLDAMTPDAPSRPDIAA